MCPHTRVEVVKAPPSAKTRLEMRVEVRKQGLLRKRVPFYPDALGRNLLPKCVPKRASPSKTRPQIRFTRKTNKEKWALYLGKFWDALHLARRVPKCLCSIGYWILALEA